MLFGYFSKHARLVRAIRRGDAPTVEQLIALGVSLERPDPEGLTPLMIAIDHGQAPIVRLLLWAGADVKTKTETGFTPLQLAIAGPGAIVKLLLKAGADPNDPPGGGVSPLLHAVTEQRQEAVAALLAHGAQAEATVNGRTTLSIALDAGVADPIIKRLVAAGADPDAKNEDGTTARTLAREKERSGLFRK